MQYALLIHIYIYHYLGNYISDLKLIIDMVSWHWCTYPHVACSSVLLMYNVISASQSLISISVEMSRTGEKEQDNALDVCRLPCAANLSLQLLGYQTSLHNCMTCIVSPAFSANQDCRTSLSKSTTDTLYCMLTFYCFAG